MSSVISLCNQAIGWLGGSLIISLDDNSKEAALCKANFEPLRDAVLEEAAWSFALKWVELPVNAGASVPSDYTAFNLPADHIRTFLVDDGSSAFHVDFYKQARTLVARYTTRLFILYISRVEDAQDFSPGFGQALATRLAADICVALTNSTKLQTSMYELYLNKLRDAVNLDALHGSQLKIYAQQLINVR